MFKSITGFLLATLAAISFTVPVQADNHQKTAEEGVAIEKVLVILSDSSLQTQGMAMVLGNTMSDQGAEIHVLLCDQAGDLSLKAYQGVGLKPKDLTPGQMLRRLIGEGASVKVCALYLPNSEYTQEDLLEGVTVATPPEMAKQMLDPSFRIFSF
jgi:predicted peroxiredoxin